MDLLCAHRTTALLAIFAATELPGALALRTGDAAPPSLPFELAVRHIIVQVTVNKSRPLSFVVDTGATSAVIRTDTAKELGLTLEGQVNARGAGSGVQTGYRIQGATWSLVGLPGFSQRVALALPLPELSSSMGRRLDGIIGGEFIRQFVVEIDYQAQQVRLHQPGGFTCSGRGEAVPIEFIDGSQPTIAATVTPDGRRRIILEPTPALADPFDRAFSGLALRALGDDFRTFRVVETLEDSSASEAGIEVGDVIAAIDGVPAERLTLSAISEMFEKPVRYSLTIHRGGRTLTVVLTPARSI